MRLSTVSNTVASFLRYSFVGGDATPSNWFLAGYNAPFIPGWFKTNDILVEVTVHDPWRFTPGGKATAT